MTIKTMSKLILSLTVLGLLILSSSYVLQNLPKEQEEQMKKIIHRANTRGHANHGWLDSHHTFSFANYYDPERIHFGMLRVLNDDIVKGGYGFGAHPHDNMEIISIPIDGALEHQDNQGHKSVIRENDVQIMSAGSGVRHSEYNHSKTKDVNFLQIWVLPKEKNIQPRYDQKTYAPETLQNRLLTVISPEKTDSTLWINQDAYFSLGNLEKGKSLNYNPQNANQGVYIFVIDGEVSVGNEKLGKRDGIGIWDVNEFSIQADANAKVLFMEVPMR